MDTVSHPPVRLRCFLLRHPIAWNLQRATIGDDESATPTDIQTNSKLKPILEPRLEDHGQLIHDKYSVIRDDYAVPKHPIVLAHGLLGFDELRLAGPYLPGVQYWRGIREALTARGVDVITATVPPSASIEQRAEELARDIEAGAKGKDVNIIAADRLPQVYYTLNKLKVETGAFEQLTTRYMSDTFNPNTPDIPDVRYFSYGAAVEPSIWSVFRLSHMILAEAEGPNDGHLDLINWTNRVKWLAGEVMGNPRKFNAIAFYLDIADMLAKEGL
ncbi:hypothetical protein N7450_010128 [Penicillium hetheringtonii]|uniref:Triacylglycerol lipase n=1 Tax=Penicillium hetheringtonii TaxID=911720 RepID=A0AAD6DCN8_9EURO|nr:hypothetical protein N7450_010128 [Penicillium hetheringtonii]